MLNLSTMDTDRGPQNTFPMVIENLREEDNLSKRDITLHTNIKEFPDE